MAANLTTVAITTRKVIRYGVLFIVIMIIVRTAIGVGLNVYKSVVPEPTKAPTAQFGPLPALPFPKQTQELPALTITAETTTGSLPNFATQAKVFYMPPYATNLFSFDSAQKKAKSLGFDSPPLQLSDTMYRFTSTTVPATLEMNIVTSAFSISYNLAANPAPLQQLPPTPEAAATLVKQMLTGATSLPTDIGEGRTGSEFLKVDGEKLVRALSLSDANFVRINLFRKDYDKLPAVTADPNQAPVWFIVAGGGDRNRSIITAQYRYFPVDEKRFETYPIKSSAQAFEELKAGKGHIANIGLNRDGNITVRDVTMAYYDADSQMEFYQPVFVFRGDREFVAYVPAVSDAYYAKQ